MLLVFMHSKRVSGLVVLSTNITFEGKFAMGSLDVKLHCKMILVGNSTCGT